MNSTLLRCVYHFGVFGPIAGAVAFSVGVVLTGLLSGQVSTLEDLVSSMTALGQKLMIEVPLSILFFGIPAALTGAAYWLWRNGHLRGRPPLLIAMGYATGVGVVVMLLCAALVTGSLLPSLATGSTIALCVTIAGPVCAMIVERWVWPPDSDSPSPSQGAAADDSTTR